MNMDGAVGQSVVVVNWDGCPRARFGVGDVLQEFKVPF
jgi:hypothetical protein